MDPFSSMNPFSGAGGIGGIGGQVGQGSGVQLPPGMTVEKLLQMLGIGGPNAAGGTNGSGQCSCGGGWCGGQGGCSCGCGASQRTNGLGF